MDEGRHFTDIKDVRPGAKNLNCLFITLDIGKATKTKDGHNVRSCRVADKTGSINVSVWDEFGEHLQSGDIIKFCKGYASLWKGSLTLYTGRQGYLEKVGDFCMVFSEVPDMSDPKAEFLQQFKPSFQQSEQGRNSPSAVPVSTSASSTPPAPSSANHHRYHPYQRPEHPGPPPSPLAKSEVSRDPRLRARAGNGGNGSNGNGNGNLNGNYFRNNGNSTGVTGNGNGNNGADVASRNVINSSRDPRTRRL